MMTAVWCGIAGKAGESHDPSAQSGAYMYTVGAFFVHEMEARKRTAELSRHEQDNSDINIYEPDSDN